MSERHVIRTIGLPDRGSYAIAVVSDTHGRPHPSLVPTLKERRPALILHAGDVGGLQLVTELEKVGPTVYVRGNVDPAGSPWPDSLSLHLTWGLAGKLDLLLLHAAATHLRLNRDALSLLRQYPAQIVVFGHSHIPFLGMDGKVCLFNPGSAGPARWGLPITMGIIELGPDQPVFKHLDLRTGKPWKPDVRDHGNAP